MFPRRPGCNLSASYNHRLFAGALVGLTALRSAKQPATAIGALRRLGATRTELTAPPRRLQAAPARRGYSALSGWAPLSST
ncbi:hypothetical protein DPQ22_07990 [Candidatus Tokpelaia sp.]|nr:hypothetical protein DPQ22_07990 [Candidatus Tokpelaia sp.]